MTANLTRETIEYRAQAAEQDAAHDRDEAEHNAESRYRELIVAGVFTGATLIGLLLPFLLAGAFGGAK